ncbi:MAG: PilN domain-containing protein, partial [Vicinamibacteria bacterium]
GDRGEHKVKMNEFNFARVPFVNERLPRTVHALAIAAVAAATVLHGVLLTRYLLREQESLDIRVSELRQELGETDARISRAQSALARNRTELGSVQTQFLTTLFRRKSFSWTGLFNELEKVTPPSVRITSISPAEEEGEIAVTMTVVGRTLQDVLEMVRGLESSSFFATIYPLDEANLEDEERGETGIAATLKLDYVEDVRGAPSPAGPETPETPDSLDGKVPLEPAEPAEEESR